MFRIADFDTPYTPWPESAAIDAVFTMWPGSPASSMRGKNA